MERNSVGPAKQQSLRWGLGPSSRSVGFGDVQARATDMRKPADLNLGTCFSVNPGHGGNFRKHRNLLTSLVGRPAKFPFDKSAPKSTFNTRTLYLALVGSVHFPCLSVSRADQ